VQVQPYRRLNPVLAVHAGQRAVRTTVEVENVEQRLVEVVDEVTDVRFADAALVVAVDQDVDDPYHLERAVAADRGFFLGALDRRQVLRALPRDHVVLHYE
jgi:hypothetical protein